MSFIHSFIGECYSEDDKAGGIFLQNISLLAGGNPFGHTKKPPIKSTLENLLQ
jgi:hypothetical protein